jgi:hypothetical protein
LTGPNGGTEAITARPKLFLDTNVCINAANEVISPREWRKVRQHIGAHYTYQISFVTVKELLGKVSRGDEEHFCENRKPLRVLCDFPRREFLPYPPIFALRTVLGLKTVARRSALPEEELSETVCKAVLDASGKTELMKGVPYPDRPGGRLKFNLDDFDSHENRPQEKHLNLLQRMQKGSVEMSDRTELAEFLLRDCGQVPEKDSCRRLGDALDAAYVFTRNLCLLSNCKEAHLEKRANDWGDIMQLYYLCDETTHFLTFDRKCRNQTQGSTQRHRILLYKDFARSL